ncbi:hypothetical protein F4825DRAFT_430173 [Nemania diffusa]|nr:hypothetical protein F4825DRAFT_430173 [Nemania diffusa]
MEAQEATRQRDAADERDGEGESRRSDVTTTTDPDIEKSNRSSGSHWGSEPGFEHVDGDIEGCGYNETTVDIIAVPCIGASPIDTWARDPLKEGYFTLPPPTELDKYSTVKELPGSSVLTPTITRVLPKASHLWIRQGIRKEVDKARVMLYRHREIVEGMTIESAADDLIGQVMKIRAGLKKARPIFFICHSIGGLVVKEALVRAREHEELRPFMYDCHGITFFATPHRGSSYLSMPNLRESIQELLFLEKPLPRSITDKLRLGHKPLLKLHDKFTDIASELRLWTFYETVDSQLSGLGGSDFDEVHFSAPITSIKSGLIGSRSEQALSLESTHANCASFGPQNLSIMHSYLYDLGEAVRKADALSSNFVHTPLRLTTQVRVELVGFYDDPDSEEEHSVRLYVTKNYLNEFLEKGPEKCLRERMNTMAPRMRRPRLSRRHAASPSRGSRTASILSNVQELGQRILGSSHSSDRARSTGQDILGQLSPEIVVTSHTPRRPSLAGATTEPLPNVDVSPRRSRGLTVPALATPGFQSPGRRSNESTRSSIDEITRTFSEPIAPDVSPTTLDNRQNRGDQTDEGHDPARRSANERVGRASTMQDFTAGFSRPKPTNRKFMWIHLPFNNPYWVKAIFDTLSETQNRSYSKLLSNDYWASKHVQGRRANWHVSYVKPGCAFVPAETGVPRTPSPARSGRNVSPSISPSHFYLYLPYLHYDTYINIIQRRNIIKRRMKHGRARPVPKDIAELESLESRVMWQYIGYEHPLNARRTLDQYGYPALQDTWARDDDQMLYKLTKQRIMDPLKRKRDMYHTGEDRPSAVSPASRLASSADKLSTNKLSTDKLTKTEETNATEDTETDLEDDIINGNVLMVDQLWLWAVDNTTLMTFFPKRESHPIEGPLFQQADLRNSIYNELNGDLTGRCENALDLAAFITLHAVTVLLDRSSHPDLEIFRIFEEAISILTERMTSSLKAFRTQSHTKIDVDSDSDSADDNRSEAIKKRHRRELEQAERQNRENTSAVLELRDMEDELHTLLGLFTEQQGAVRLMRDSYGRPELAALTGCGRAFLDEALRRLEEYEKLAHDMLGRVDATRKDYEKLQEMIQRQAQVDEVRWSRLQAELASSQNLSVMIFTTFTVIFLPLSFFTSLFGMNTQEWGGPDPNNFPSLELIGVISLPASALLIAITLVAAYSGRIQTLIKISYRTSRACAELVAVRPLRALQRQLVRLEPQVAKDSAHKRRRAKEMERRRVRRTKERGYDFWGAVRAERGSEYEIPEVNRKRALQSRLAGRGTWSRLVGEEGR